jgi:hypothetical protein
MVTLGFHGGSGQAEPVLGRARSRAFSRLSREQWFEVIRGRLGDLAQSGRSKAFLVRSVRDSIRRMLDYSGAEIGESERDRAEMRERIQRMLEDPAELAVFRTLLAGADPSAEALSDDEVSARLRRIAESGVLRQMPADDVTDR